MTRPIPINRPGIVAAEKAYGDALAVFGVLGPLLLGACVGCFMGLWTGNGTTGWLSFGITAPIGYLVILLMAVAAHRRNIAKLKDASRGPL